MRFKTACSGASLSRRLKGKPFNWMLGATGNRCCTEITQFSPSSSRWLYQPLHIQNKRWPWHEYLQFLARMPFVSAVGGGCHQLQHHMGDSHFPLSSLHGAKESSVLPDSGALRTGMTGCFPGELSCTVISSQAKIPVREKPAAALPWKPVGRHTSSR